MVYLNGLYLGNQIVLALHFYVHPYYVDTDGNFTVRPCFYLNSDVSYSQGSGTGSDPIRIEV